MKEPLDRAIQNSLNAMRATSKAFSAITEEDLENADPQSKEDLVQVAKQMLAEGARIKQELETDADEQYDVPIRSPKHAAFCKEEAARRYDGRLIKDEEGMLVVKDQHGQTHTDAVLRALSLYESQELPNG